MNNISLILLTKNESKNIGQWRNWLPKLKKVNELVAVDDNSTDGTIKVINKLASKKLKVKTLARDLNNNFSAQHQYAVENTSNNMILWLDADETPSSELIEYINNIDTCQYVNFAFLRSDIFLGSTLHHGETANQYFLRLFDKRYGYYSGMVHELWVSSKPTIMVDKEIIHSSHIRLHSFFEKINFYSDIRAKELFAARVPVNLIQIIAYPTGKFFKNYVFHLGFLDGTPGIILAIGMSFHSFLVRAKLWCLYNP